MRIVAGSLRGRSIQAPSGDSTRPTTDRVREAIFSSLYSLRNGFEGAIVLDAFAGSGALGIEAISRGASYAVFCESGKQALKFLKENIASCGISADQARVLAKDVFTQTATFSLVFDLVFFDPPYAYDANRVLRFARAMFEAGKLDRHAILVYEHDAKDADGVAQACIENGFEAIANKRYGKTGVAFICLAHEGDTRAVDDRGEQQ